MKKYIGIGDLVLDIYYDTQKTLLGYYPGSSVINDLINLKRLSKESYCGCITTAGSDWASSYILDKLKAYDIDVFSIKRTTKPTKRISIIVDGDESRNLLECPLCGNKQWYSDVKFPDISHNDICLGENDVGVIIINNVKKDTLKTAYQFKNAGWKIALDLGYISHLRYMNVEKINELFSYEIDYLQTKPAILDFLKSKLNLNSVEELFKRLRCIYMNVTDGNRGSTLYYMDSEGVKISPCPSILAEVKDTTGAGDAFFSVLLSKIGAKGYFEKNLSEVQQYALRYATDRIGVIGALGEVEYLSMPSSNCQGCGGQIIIESKKLGNKKLLTEKNVTRLLERTQNALKTEAWNKIRNILSNVKGTVFTVGTGGSFAAAVFAAKFINNMHISVYACAKHPRDVLIEGTKHTSLILLFSYSGRTWDIRNVYDFCKGSGIDVYIITMMDYAANHKYFFAEDIISYCGTEIESRERGFISIARTIIPVSLFIQAFYEPKDGFFDFIADCYHRWDVFFSELKIDWSGFKENPVINIFSGIDTASACADLESKIIESGIGIVVIHEKKDFSHGRFNILEYHPPYVTVILNNQVGAYSHKLMNYLSGRNISRNITMSTDKGMILGDFDLLIGCQLFAKYLSKELGIDLTKPDYPEDAMRIYKYSRRDLI